MSAGSQAAATGGPDGRHGPHAFVDDLERPSLSDDDRHHLERVVRLRAGDALTVSDGVGRWRPATFGPDLEVAGPIAVERAPLVWITIGFAPVKGDRPEWVVQKLTELGVDEIVPFWAERSVVRWDTDRAIRQTGRLRRVAREAAMQSRRCRMPSVGEPVPFAQLAVRPGVRLAERDGPPPTGSDDDAPGIGLTVLIGPEGGWSDAERAAVDGRVGFGAQVLRAETAAVAAATVLGALRSGVVRPA